MKKLVPAAGRNRVLQKKIQITTTGVATLYRKEALKFVLRWLCENREHWRISVRWIESVNEKAAECPLWPQHMVKQAWSGFHNAKIDVLGTYQQAPELAEALLLFLQRKWRRLERSKLGQLKKFLSYSPVVKWEDSFNFPAAIVEANRIGKLISEAEKKLPPVPHGGRATTEEDHQFFTFARSEWAKRRHSGPVPDKMGNVPICDLPGKHIQSAISKLPWGAGVTIDDIVKAKQWVATNQNAGKKFAEEVVDKNGFLCVGKPRR